jgi:dihydropteroate synthase-like protein
MRRYLFVTGKLAAESLRNSLKEIPGLEYKAAILPISVAALMDTRFIAKHLDREAGCDVIMIPGKCEGDLAPIEDRMGVEVIRGPKSLKDIPAYLGGSTTLKGYGESRVRILAEIVDAHKLSLEQILARALYFRSSGADIIDLGCSVGCVFPEIGKIIAALKEKEFLVSVDSFNPEDILTADEAGVDFVLSINSRNMHLARRLRSKVVVIPDFEKGTESLERNIAQLEDWRVPFIIDPILKPIGFGFAESIGEFIRIRRKYPKAEMLMGLGNITELTDADTTGVNAVMAGIITELGIDYVLTTEVISWARGAVKELDLARRLMYYACTNKVLPKRLSDGLITIKDPPFETFSEDELRSMQIKTRDRNFRIFADRDFIYAFNSQVFVKDTDIQAIFEKLAVADASQAFYMGRELQKALMALKLGKRYVQEEDLRWGYLSQ